MNDSPVGPGDHVELLVLQQCAEQRIGHETTEATVTTTVVRGEFVSRTKIEGVDEEEYVIRTEGSESPSISMAPETYLWKRVGNAEWEPIGQVHCIGQQE